MGKLVEFTTEDGVVVVVETADPATGTRLVSRGENPAAQATRTFEGALDSVRAAAHSALSVFRDGALRPDSVELEFGVKLSAEAGAIIAKGAAEGQLVVRLGWNSAGGGAGAVGAAAPGAAASHGTAPEGTAPGSTVPGSTVPGSTVPGSTVPVPGSAPATPPPASPAVPGPSPRS